jgi:hypothetical protein
MGTRLAGRRADRIDDAVVESAVAMVDRSGIVDQVATWRAMDRRMSRRRWNLRWRSPA